MRQTCFGVRLEVRPNQPRAVPDGVRGLDSAYFSAANSARDHTLNGLAHRFSLGEIPFTSERDRGASTLLADRDRQASEENLEVGQGIYGHGSPPPSFRCGGGERSLPTKRLTAPQSSRI